MEAIVSCLISLSAFQSDGEEARSRRSATEYSERATMEWIQSGHSSSVRICIKLRGAVTPSREILGSALAVIWKITQSYVSDALVNFNYKPYNGESLNACDV